MTASTIRTPTPTIYDAHLRLLFIHGFLGRCERTFKGLMEPLVACLKQEEQFKNVKIDLHSYDYETKGVYREAPLEFVRHLQQLDYDWHFGRNVDVDHNEQVPNFVIIIAHSMGGLVAADAIQMIYGSPVGGFALGLRGNTRVIGLVTFDTPFFALDTTFFELALHDLQHRPWDVVFALVRARAKPGIRSDLVVGALQKLTRIKRGIFSDHFEFLTFMLCGTSAYTASNMVSDLIQRRHSASRHTLEGHVQFMTELLETVTHRERFTDLINNKHIHFRCYYNKMHIPSEEEREDSTKRRPQKFIHLPEADPLFMRFFKPFEWSSDPSPKHQSRTESMVIAHTQMFDPRHNKSIDWLVQDVAHLVMSMFGRALDNGQDKQAQTTALLAMPTPGGHHHQLTLEDLPALYPPIVIPACPPSPPPSSRRIVSDDDDVVPLSLPMTTLLSDASPSSSPKPLPARSKTILRLSAAPVHPPSPTFKSNFVLNRSNALMYRNNRRHSTRSDTSIDSSSSTIISRDLPTPQDSPTIEIFPISNDATPDDEH